MKIFKRIVSLVTAAALSLSAFSALTVSAETEGGQTEITSPVVQTASVAAQLRATDNKWETRHANSNKFVEKTDDVETTGKNFFGALYYFDPVTIPENAAITKVTFAVYQGSTRHSSIPFAVLHTENPEDTGDIAKIFAVVKTAKGNEANINAGNTKTTVLETKDVVPSKDSNGNLTNADDRTEVCDVTKYFTENKPNSYFVYNTNESESDKRRLSGTATLTVEFTTAEAQIIRGGTITPYGKFEDAYTNAEAGDTIKLLSDTTTTKGISFNKGNLTIDGNGKTIHNGNNYIAIDGSGQLSLSNLTIEGNSNVEIKGNTTISADNVNIAHLQINGSTVASKGTIRNSQINALRCFAKLTLEDTKVSNINFPNVNAGSGDSPKITSNADFQSASITIEKISNVGESGRYILFEGGYVPPADKVTMPADSGNYEYADGIIKDKTVNVKEYTVSAESGIADKVTISPASAEVGARITVTVTGENYADNSLTAAYATESEPDKLHSVSLSKSTDKTYTFTMPDGNVTLSAIFDGENAQTIIASDDFCYEVKTGTAVLAHYIRNQSDTDEKNLALGFDVAGIDFENTIVTLELTKSNGATYSKTEAYDIGANPFGTSFNHTLASGNTKKISKADSSEGGQYGKCRIVLDASKFVKVGDKIYLNVERAEQVENQPGNDYYAIPSADVNDGAKAVKAEYLPKLVIEKLEPAPDKEKPEYGLQSDTIDDLFQYHYAGGTDAFNNGTSEDGKAYDIYLWVPADTAPGELKGLVAVKLNLIEVPFVYSTMLREELAKKNFGILFVVCQKDPYKYNNVLNAFSTKTDYKGDTLITDTNEFTTDGKDAAQILDEILAGIAAESGYTEIADTVPLITMGHSAASGFGNKSANWNKDRVIAQIHMKNGMSGGEAMVPGVPQLQYAAQYTEHAMGVDRDRSVRDARYHISDKRAKNTDYLVSHIIEWGSGHYDWSDNATYMLTKYIIKAIDARLPADYNTTHTLNDLTNTGYLMKPFAKDGDKEQRAGYYRDYLQGWLSNGKANNTASDDDKKASFWFFDEEFANEINKFTNYAIPESPDPTATGVAGQSYSDIEPFMLMKNPAQSTWSTNPASAANLISPFTSFATNPFSRYGSNRFVNYTKMASPDSNSSNTANLSGYDTATVDTYYMGKVPAITAKDQSAYDGEGNDVIYPENTKAEFVPLIAPYEVAESELLNMSEMQVDADNPEAANVVSATRTTLRFHNNRVYFRSGNSATLAEGYNIMDSYGFIKSPEVRNAEGFVTSAFKATSSQMNIPYVNKGTEQTITLEKINDVNVKGAAANPVFDVNYTSTDADLQKYTDVFVEYGPAKAVRTINADGSYSWKIEVLLDKIPKNAQYPIEVNVVVSNLGKWEKTYGATVSQTFNIISEEGGQTTPAPTTSVTPSTPIPTTSVTPSASPSTEPSASPTTAPTAKPTLTPISVTAANNLVYDGKAKVLATVSGIQAGDTAVYTINGKNADKLEATDAGTYEIGVTVSRNGQADDFTWSGTVTIAKAKITDAEITCTAQTIKYDGEAHDVLTVTAADGDTVTYYLDDQPLAEKPTFTDEGVYNIKVRVSRGDNYEPYERTFKITVTSANIIEGIEVTPYTGAYDGADHAAVVISGTESGDVVSYTMNDTETNEVPQIKNAGEYEISITISRADHADYHQNVTAVISKAAAVISAESAQSAIYDGTAKKVTAILNNDEGTLKFAITNAAGETVEEMRAEGRYNVTVSADETANYLAAEPVEVVFIIEKILVNSKIIIGRIVDGTDSTSVEITIEDPTPQMADGIIIAAVYDENNTCQQVAFVKDGKATFGRKLTDETTIKVFVWNALAGENAMTPLMNAYAEEI